MSVYEIDNSNYIVEEISYLQLTKILDYQKKRQEKRRKRQLLKEQAALEKSQKEHHEQSREQNVMQKITEAANAEMPAWISANR